jgi:hypothetical protein
MRRDFLADRFAQVVPQVPAVADLDRAGQRPADRLAVGARPVTAHDLDAGMSAQPGLDQVGGAGGQDVDAPAGPGVDQDGGVAAAAAQREVVDPEHPGYLLRGQRDPQQDAQHRMAGPRHGQFSQQPRPGPAG